MMLLESPEPLYLSSSESFGIQAGVTGSESIVVETNTSISQTFGDVSIVNGFIYLGTGDSAGSDR